jgi:hypothetical protein
MVRLCSLSFEFEEAVRDVLIVGISKERCQPKIGVRVGKGEGNGVPVKQNSVANPKSVCV